MTGQERGAMPQPLSKQGAGREAVFRTEGVTKVYRTDGSEVWALRGVDLEILAAETLVLLGPSGRAVAFRSPPPWCRP